MRKYTQLIAAMTALLIPLTGCSIPNSPDEADGALKVVAAFYPLEFVATAIGGDLVDVENLVPQGVEPHDLELTPSQISTIDGADLLLFISGFMPALEDAATQSPPGDSLDALKIDGMNPIQATADGHSHGESSDSSAQNNQEMANDTHIWLDPKRLILLANEIAAKLSSLDPENTHSFETNRDAFVIELEDLDGSFLTGLATCERTLIVTSHAAFGYLADAYGLEQEAISGLTPELEPTPKRLNEIGKEAKADGTTTIFFEILASPKVAKTLADDLHIETAVLDPLEGVSEGQTYFSVMKRNLSVLRKALNCK